MLSIPSLNELEFAEIKLIDNYFTVDDYELIQKALTMYTPGYWVPIGIDIFSPDIQNQKRLSYQETCKLFEKYSPEWAFTSKELEITIKAIKHFIRLPLPLYGDLSSIKKRKSERELAILILAQLI